MSRVPAPWYGPDTANDSYQQIIYRVLSNTDPLPDLAGKCVTGGRVNLQNALGSVPPPTMPTVSVAATNAAAAEAGELYAQRHGHQGGRLSTA